MSLNIKENGDHQKMHNTERFYKVFAIPGLSPSECSMFEHSMESIGRAQVAPHENRFNIRGQTPS
jgi:hypothetical protein